METIITINIFVFLIVAFVCVLIGLDLKKWYSWLLGLYGFLTGSLIGLLRPGEPLSLQVGAIFAIGVMFIGAIARRNKQLYTREDLQMMKEKYGKPNVAAKKSREEKAKRNQ